MFLFRNIITDDGVKIICDQINSVTSLVALKIFFSGLIIFYFNFIQSLYRNKTTKDGNEMLMTLKELNNKKIKTEVYI